MLLELSDIKRESHKNLDATFTPNGECVYEVTWLGKRQALTPGLNWTQFARDAAICLW